MTLKVSGQDLTATATDIHTQLKLALNNKWADLIELGFLPSIIDKVTHPAKFILFHSAAGIPDGYAFGIVINQQDLGG